MDEQHVTYYGEGGAQQGIQDEVVDIVDFHFGNNLSQRADALRELKDTNNSNNQTQHYNGKQVLKLELNGILHVVHKSE